MKDKRIQERINRWIETTLYRNDIDSLERHIAQFEGYLTCLEDLNIISEDESNVYLYDKMMKVYKEQIKIIYKL